MSHTVLQPELNDTEGALGRWMVTIFNNDHDNTSKLGAGSEMNYVETSEGRLVDAKGGLARYVRLISNGNNADEIEQSISGLKEKSSKILESAQSAMQNARREMVGTRATLPPVMENNTDPQQFTAEQIAAMSATEYAKHRAKLLGNAAQPQKGIFG